MSCAANCGMAVTEAAVDTMAAVEATTTAGCCCCCAGDGCPDTCAVKRFCNETRLAISLAFTGWPEEFWTCGCCCCTLMALPRDACGTGLVGS